MIRPGATIGIIGGGQLGRMLALAAAPLGYKCHIFDPHERPCAADVAAQFTRAAFDDVAALERFGTQCDVITYEFENLPVEPLAVVSSKLHPGWRSLAIAQDRAREKSFVEHWGGRVAPWRKVSSLDDLTAAMDDLGLPVVLKTRRDGYDGKGQCWIRAREEAAAAWQAIGGRPAVAEAAISFAAEFSVILARPLGGRPGAYWSAIENRHQDGILRTSTVPASPAVQAVARQAEELAIELAERLEHVGVLTVEFFACTDGPLVNEIAPRVHNSGHWTIEGSATSQFEQHIRAICGLPLGSTALRAERVTMENLIGPDVERWPALIAEDAAVHLYDKGEPRPGRKMGHVTRLG